MYDYFSYNQSCKYKKINIENKDDEIILEFNNLENIKNISPENNNYINSSDLIYIKSITNSLNSNSKKSESCYQEVQLLQNYQT